MKATRWAAVSFGIFGDFDFGDFGFCGVDFGGVDFCGVRECGGTAGDFFRPADFSGMSVVCCSGLAGFFFTDHWDDELRIAGGAGERPDLRPDWGKSAGCRDQQPLPFRILKFEETGLR